MPRDTPLDLVTKIKQDPEYEAPLDLSKKCNSAMSARSDSPLCTFKNEPEEYEISEGSNREEFKSSDSQGTCKTNPGEEGTEKMQVEMAPINLSTGTTSELMMNVKKEPQSPGSEVDMRSSRA